MTWPTTEVREAAVMLEFDIGRGRIPAEIAQRIEPLCAYCREAQEPDDEGLMSNWDEDAVTALVASAKEALRILRAMQTEKPDPDDLLEVLFALAPAIKDAEKALSE